MWLRLKQKTKGGNLGVAFNPACVERVEQLKKGCRVVFKSGGSVDLDHNWTYLADLLGAYDPEDQETDELGPDRAASS